MNKRSLDDSNIKYLSNSINKVQKKCPNLCEKEFDDVYDWVISKSEKEGGYGLELMKSLKNVTNKLLEERDDMLDSHIRSINTIEKIKPDLNNMKNHIKRFYKTNEKAIMKNIELDMLLDSLIDDVDSLIDGIEDFEMQNKS